MGVIGTVVTMPSGPAALGQYVTTVPITPIWSLGPRLQLIHRQISEVAHMCVIYTRIIYTEAQQPK